MKDGEGGWTFQYAAVLYSWLGHNASVDREATRLVREILRGAREFFFVIVFLHCVPLVTQCYLVVCRKVTAFSGKVAIVVV